MQGRGSERGPTTALTSLVFPTYNAAAFLERSWRDIERFLLNTRDPWEILFVCDGCTDGTAERLLDLTRAESQRVRILSYQPNRGKGYAVRYGLMAARGFWRIFTDVDLAYGFDDIERLAQSLRSGAEVAIASRTHPQSRLILSPSLQGYAYRRHLQSLAFSVLARALLPLHARDTQAGLKGMTAAVAQVILPRLACDSFGFDCELLAHCTQQGVQIREVPVTVRFENHASTTSVRGMGRMIADLWSIRRSLRQAAVPVPETNQPERRAA